MRTPLEAFGLLPADIFRIDLAQASAVIADDCVIHEARGLPVVGGTWHGPQGFVDLMRAIDATFPNFRFELDRLLSNDTDSLAIKGTISADLPLGRLELSLVEFWTLRDGKFVDILPMWHDTQRVNELMPGRTAARPASPSTPMAS